MHRIPGASAPGGRLDLLALGRHLTLCSSLGLLACGGAPALLQPAHPLPRGVVEYGAGVTTQVALGSSQDEIARAEANPEPARDAESADQWLRGAYQKTSIAPGVSPWVGARAGLGDGNEGSLVYTGRNLRLGARHAWRWNEYALSLGGGVASVLGRRAVDQSATEQDGLPAGRVEWPARGLGVDVPVSFGWSSQSELLQAWAGVRAGFEALYGDLPFTDAGYFAPVEAQAIHWQEGGFVGLSIGVSPVWVRAELHAAWHQVNAEAELPRGTGSETQRDDFSAFTLAPAGAILVQF